MRQDAHLEKPTKILFITRNYPPALGGMEKYSFDLYNSLLELTDVTLLANTKGIRFLPFFTIRVIIKLILKSHQYTHIHFGDGVLSPIALLCKICTKKKISTTIHALDITYNNSLYQLVVPFCVAKLDLVFCVSAFTREECVKRKIPDSKCHIITNGINYSTPPDKEIQPKGTSDFFNSNNQYKVLLSIGRLIKRKGNLWFIQHVFPKLSKDYIYLIAGNGPEKSHIEKFVKDHKLQARVILLGNINNNEKQYLLTHADIFLMPNISIAGDTEGFGISIIEATSMGLPVIGSNIQGITSAIIPGETGTLVNEQDASSYIHAIDSPQPDKTVIKNSTKRHFEWSKLAEKYLEILAPSSVHS